MNTPEFDFEQQEEPPLPAQPWREAPAALFLSWPLRKQRAYCAARDEDSARIADTEVEAEWFRARAWAYKESHG